MKEVRGEKSKFPHTGKSPEKKGEYSAPLCCVDLGPWLCADYRLYGLPGDSGMLAMMLEEQCGREKAQAFFKAFAEAFVTERDIAEIKALGAELVWLPLDYRLFCGEGPAVSEEAPGFRLLDGLLEWCGKYGLRCIPQLCAAPGGQNREEGGEALLFEDGFYRELFLSFWSAAAKRYRQSSVIAGYALLCRPEPGKGFGGAASEEAEGWEILNRLYAQAAEQIRKADPDRLLLFSGRHGGQDLSGLKLPKAGNNALLWEGAAGAELPGEADHRTAPLFVKARPEELSSHESRAVTLAVEPYKDCGYEGLLQYAENSPYLGRFGDILRRYGRNGRSVCGLPCTAEREKMEARLSEFQKELPLASGNKELPLREEEMKRWIDRLYYSKLLAFAFSRRVAELSAEKLRETIRASVESGSCVKTGRYQNALRFFETVRKGETGYGI